MPNNTHGHKLLADARSKCRLGGNKKGAIGPQSGGIAFHLSNTDIESKAFVKQFYHIGGVTRPATKSGLRRNTFIKMGMNTR